MILREDLNKNLYYFFRQNAVVIFVDDFRLQCVLNCVILEHGRILAEDLTMDVV